MDASTEKPAASCFGSDTGLGAARTNSTVEFFFSFSFSFFFWSRPQTERGNRGIERGKEGDQNDDKQRKGLTIRDSGVFMWESTRLESLDH